jgi:hypothetical protein
MAINFNTEPYYDDFDQTKSFHRILFRPGYAVQARELTQLQTQLQDQIRKFGNHIFVEGTVVLDGQRFFEKNLSHIKIGTTLFNGLLTAQQIIGKTLTGSTSGCKALIKGISSEPNIGNVLVVAKTSGTNFLPGETITIVIPSTTIVNGITVVNNTPYTSTINPIDTTTTPSTSPFGNAMMFDIGPGVYYIGGKFVYTDSQSIILDALSNTSSKNVGFNVIESATSAEQDDSLLDNAQGSPNYAAPGADRYAVDLVLTSKNFQTVNNDFIEIARIENGELVVNKDKTIYSEIGNELARRTFDESGDYTVKQWKIQLEENSAAVIAATPAAANKFIANLEPGKGYIKGYEFETINQTPLQIDKGRDIETVTGSNSTITYGNFVYVSTMSGVFDPNSLQSVELKSAGLISTTGTVGSITGTGPWTATITGMSSTTGLVVGDAITAIAGTGTLFGGVPTSAVVASIVSASSITYTVTGGTTPTAGTVTNITSTNGITIGTARVRYLDYLTGAIETTAAIYRMYLLGITMNTGKTFAEVQRITSGTASTLINALSKEDGIGSTFLSGTDVPGLLFQSINQYIDNVNSILIS